MVLLLLAARASLTLSFDSEIDDKLCLFVYLFVCLFLCLFVCLFVCSLVR